MWLAGFIFTRVLVLVALVFVVLPIFFHSLRDPPFIVAIYDKVDISSLCLLGVMMMVWYGRYSPFVKQKEREDEEEKE